MKHYLIGIFTVLISGSAFSQDLKTPEIVNCGTVKKLSKDISAQNIIIKLQLKKAISAEYHENQVTNKRKYKKIPVEIRYARPYLEEEQIAGMGLFGLLNLAKGTGQKVCVSFKIRKDESQGELGYTIYNYAGIGVNIESAIQDLIKNH